MATLTNSDTEGTSFFSVTIHTTVSILNSILGEAQYKASSPVEIVKYCWDCETEDDHVFTVYDWMETEIDEDEVYEFHIGAFSESASRTAKQELLNLINQ